MEMAAVCSSHSAPPILPLRRCSLPTSCSLLPFSGGSSSDNGSGGRRLRRRVAAQRCRLRRQAHRFTRGCVACLAHRLLREEHALQAAESGDNRDRMAGRSRPAADSRGRALHWRTAAKASTCCCWRCDGGAVGCDGRQADSGRREEKDWRCCALDGRHAQVERHRAPVGKGNRGQWTHQRVRPSVRLGMNIGVLGRWLRDGTCDAAAPANMRRRACCVARQGSRALACRQPNASTVAGPNHKSAPRPARSATRRHTRPAAPCHAQRSRVCRILLPAVQQRRRRL
jgi:hypothetical protein